MKERMKVNETETNEGRVLFVYLHSVRMWSNFNETKHAFTSFLYLCFISINHAPPLISLPLDLSYTNKKEDSNYNMSHYPLPIIISLYPPIILLWFLSYNLLSLIPGVS